MRLRIIAFLSFCLVYSGGFAQTSVGLRIDHKAGQSEFDVSNPVVTTMGESVYIDRLEYYLSSLPSYTTGVKRLRLRALMFLLMHLWTRYTRWATCQV